jgi:phage protein U
MYAQLGTIVFEGIGGFSTFAGSRAAVFAETPIVGGKPRIQRTGQALETIEISMLLHADIAPPELSLAALEAIRSIGQPVPFILGTGEVLGDFVAAREREGAKLAQVILERADAITAHAADARTLMPAIRAGQRQKLENRLADLPQPLDPGRFEQELVLALQKLDVDEELDRLDSHLAELRRILKGGKEPVGRRLDFLLQEFNREANTLGSKSVDARTSNAAVELKVLIDQVREQIQNIE